MEGSRTPKQSLGVEGVTYINRKRYPTAFSIERLFERLALELRRKGLRVEAEEAPYYNNTFSKVWQNMQWARTQVQGKAGDERKVFHITGDVTSCIFGLQGPTVITIHDCNPLLRYSRTHPRYWFYRWFIYEWPVRRAAAVTVISEKTRVELLQLTDCSPGKLHVIPNFVDPSFVHRPKSFTADYPTILQIGVKENKNIARLAEALHGIPCRLEIVGEPAEVDRRALERYAIDAHWATGLSDEEVRHRYEACDLLAFASTYEGFGLPILEAQVTGRPVITSALSPHREIAGAGGAELVDPLRVESIRQGLLRVINDEEYRDALVSRGRINATHYQLEAVADQYIDLYARLL